jgi:hypothetical protein
LFGRQHGQLEDANAVEQFACRSENPLVIANQRKQLLLQIDNEDTRAIGVELIGAKHASGFLTQALTL